MTSKAGLSGASIAIINDYAFKLNYLKPDRVVEQGDWLVLNEATNLPLVKQVMPSGYVMEVLQPLKTADVDLGNVIAALNMSVWRYSPVNLVNTPHTMIKCSKIVEQYAPDILARTIDQLAFIRTTEDCLTHGDPTAENVMLRENGDEPDYVIIDPIPSTEAVPDDLAVDVGKLLQSAHGWEEMKGEQRCSWTPDDVAEHFVTEVFDVAELWCIVHFIRTLPYAKEEVRTHVIDKLHELLGI